MAAMREALGDDHGTRALPVVRVDRLALPREIGYYDDMIVVPPPAYVPAALSAKAPGGSRPSSMRCVRRATGIGDFTDLATLARLADAQGASAVGLNPLHQLP